MNIEHIISERSGVFNVIENNENIGELTYVITDSPENPMVLNHAWINPVYRGQGIGDQLVLKAIAFAKEKELKIVPMCSFTVRYFEKHTEYSDLVIS